MKTEPAKENEGSAGLTAQTASILAAADIPPSKLGAARASRLSDPERELYWWILRRFGARGRPASGALGEYARGLGLDASRSLETLAREDLVHLDGDGEVAVAYPFSGHPTAHRVRFPGGQEAYAMCAIDALGIAAMFEQSIEISSSDPLSGEEIAVAVGSNFAAEWWPSSAVVVTGALSAGGDSCRGCCPVLNFFASLRNAERWLAERPEVRGETISMEQAILAGRAIFGNVLR